MVLSNSKLKRKKKEAAAALALQSDIESAPAEDKPSSSSAVVKSEKKKKKQKRGDATDPKLLPESDDKTVDESKEISEVESGFLNRAKGDGGKRNRDTAGASPDEVHGVSPEDSNAAPPVESIAVPSEADLTRNQSDEPKNKIRKKPRWEVGENGKRVKPAKDLDDDSAKTEVPIQSVNGISRLEEPKTTSNVEAVSAEGATSALGAESRVFEGNEPWLASKRSKKKKAATDKWGKRINNPSEDEAAIAEETPVSKSNLEVEIDLKKVMVGGMPYYISENDIHEFFHECGTISELDCMTFPDTGKFKGIAFVTFRTEEAAKRALALDGADMGGRFLKIEMCKIKPTEGGKKSQFKEPPKKQPGCLAAYIGNLSYDITEKEVRKFFKGCKIESIRFAESKDTGEFKGFGHIDFADDDSLESAMKLDQQPLLGRPLKIAYSVPQKDKIMGVRGGPKPVENKKGCFTCGEEGHMSYNCPQKTQ